MQASTVRRLWFVLVVWIVVLDVAVFLLQKQASSSASGDGFAFYISMARQPWVWGVVGLALLQLLTWTRVLSQVDLSLAYPVTSLSYPLTMLAAGALFHEPI